MHSLKLWLTRSIAKLISLNIRPAASGRKQTLRGYFADPDHETEIVITDELDRETAIAIIEFAKLVLKDEPTYADMTDWKFSLIRVPNQNFEGLLVTGHNSEYGSIMFEIKESAKDIDAAFELVRVFSSRRDCCGG